MFILFSWIFIAWNIFYIARWWKKRHNHYTGWSKKAKVIHCVCKLAFWPSVWRSLHEKRWRSSYYLLQAYSIAGQLSKTFLILSESSDCQSQSDICRVRRRSGPISCSCAVNFDVAQGVKVCHEKDYWLLALKLKYFSELQNLFLEPPLIRSLSFKFQWLLRP